MKSFINVFKFEFLNYAKNKAFVGLTIALVIIIGIGLTIPKYLSSSDTGSDTAVSDSADSTKIAVSGIKDEGIITVFNSALPDYQFVIDNRSESELKAEVTNEKYNSAIVITGQLSYNYIVKNIGLYDTVQPTIDETLKYIYQTKVLAGLGADTAQIPQILTPQITGNVVQVDGGKDQTSNFFYTYIMIFALYMAILLYGQSIASTTATEKSNRAMELLITATKPTSLMFGKILGTGLAGLIQIGLIFGSAYGFYHLNADFYADNEIIQSIFNIPLSTLLLALVFFILGFSLYAFIYGALGSLVSRMEQLNTTIMPATFMFIIAFVIVMFSMSSGNVDSHIMKVVSYIPFTSPMAMFTRIALGNVSSIEVIISIAILVVSVIIIGYLAALIYRVGVLMYGQPPKPKELFKIIKTAKM